MDEYAINKTDMKKTKWNNLLTAMIMAVLVYATFLIGKRQGFRESVSLSILGTILFLDEEVKKHDSRSTLAINDTVVFYLSAKTIRPK
jgi:glucose uptake protein GlcU